MNCTNHPETEAKGVCSYCGKPFCGECLVEVKGKLYCKEDLGNVLDEAKRGGAATDQYYKRKCKRKFKLWGSSRADQK